MFETRNINGVDYLTLTGVLEDVNIPRAIKIGSEENVNWIYELYEIALEKVIGESTETDIVLQEEQLFSSAYQWLKTNLFDHQGISTAHVFEIGFGIGALASMEGLADFVPDGYADYSEQSN